VVRPVWTVRVTWVRCGCRRPRGLVAVSRPAELGPGRGCGCGRGGSTCFRPRVRSVPAGLGELSGPLRALADFLRLNADLVAVAARASTPLEVKPPATAALRRWVRALPEAEKDEVLVRLLRGEDARLRADLLRRFHGPTDEPTAGGGRTAGQLLAAAEELWAERQRKVGEREAAERRRREQAAAAVRRQRLDALAGHQDEAWRQVAAFIQSKKPKEYDAAITLLCDLKALSERDGATKAFTGRVRRLRDEHARKPSLLDRLDRAGLG